MDDIEQQVRAPTGSDPRVLQNAAVLSVQEVMTGDEATAKDARVRAAEAVARAPYISVKQARSQIGQHGKTYRENISAAKQQGITAMQAATAAVSAGAILALVALALGALASWFGGTIGTKRRCVVQTETLPRTI